MGWKEVWERISAGLLIVVGAAFTLAAFVFEDGKFPFIRDTNVAIIVLLSLLAFSIGLQRFFMLHELSRRTEKIEKLIGRMSTDYAHDLSQILETVKVIGLHEEHLELAVGDLGKAHTHRVPGEITEAALDVISSCSEHEEILATCNLFGRPDNNAPGMPDRYLESLASHVQRARDNGGNVSYLVAIAANPPLAAARASERRRKIFSTHDVDEKLIVKYTSFAWPVEVLIGSDKVLVAFSGQNGERYNFGITVTDRTFVDQARTWFRTVIWANAHDEPPSTFSSANSKVAASVASREA